MIFLLDMDGVLANFVKATFRTHGKEWTKDEPTSWNYYKDWGMTADEFWKPLKSKGFWSTLEEYPWAATVYSWCLLRGEVVISTCPCISNECTSGKLYWLEFFLGRTINPSEYMIGSRKELMAQPGRILIDDNPKNCEKFIDAGGDAFLFGMPWNAAYDPHDLGNIAALDQFSTVLESSGQL